jgi:hypothetical protein
MKRIAPFILILAFFSFVSCSAAKPSKVEVRKQGPGQWELLVNGKPYFVKGVVYSFTVVGDDSNEGTLRDWAILDLDNNGKIDVAYDSWVDRNGNNLQDPDEPAVGDWQLLKEMGCNTIRVYQLASDDPRLKDTNDFHGARFQFEHPANKVILRDLYARYGIRVIIGHFFGEWTLGSGAKWDPGTDYTDPQQRQRLLNCVRVMVEEHKDEPYTLLWLLGNENFNPYDHDNAESQVAAFLSLNNEAAKLIHELDPNHPVAICNWHLDKLDDIARYAPEIDIYGTNDYRHGLTPDFETVKQKFDRPVLITEYGIPTLDRNNLDREIVKNYHQVSWRDIWENRYGGKGVGNSIGGVVFAWSDMWSLAGSPTTQDLGEFLGVKYSEYFGLTGQGNGTKSPFLRQLKSTYYFYQKAWTGSETKMR